MKKFIIAFAMLAVVGLAFSSCKKDDKEEPKIVKRLAMCGDQWDKYVFTYDNNAPRAGMRERTITLPLRRICWGSSQPPTGSLTAAPSCCRKKAYQNRIGSAL